MASIVRKWRKMEENIMLDPRMADNFMEFT